MPRCTIHTLPSGTVLNQKELPCPILQPFFGAVHIQGLINVGAKDLALCLIWDIFEWPFKIQSSLWDWMRPLLQWYYNFISPSDESCFPHILTGVVPKIIPQNTSCMQISISICFLKKLSHERALPTLQNPISVKSLPQNLASSADDQNSCEDLTCPLPQILTHHTFSRWTNRPSENIRPPSVRFWRYHLPINSTTEPHLVTKLANQALWTL